MLKVVLHQIDEEKIYDIPVGTTVIGRKLSDILIVHELVSGKHAEVNFTGNRLVLTDLDSTNGTFVNSKQIDRQPLRDKDIISFGSKEKKEAPSFIVNIQGEESSSVVKKKKNILRILLYFVLFLTFILGFLFFILGTDNQTSNVLEKIEKVKKTSVKLYTEGHKMMLALGDYIYLPKNSDSVNSTWKKNVKYELSTESNNYNARIYFISIWNENSELTITIQRFIDSWAGDSEVEALSNFVWHQEFFLIENNIDGNFMYKNTSIGPWQWITWSEKSVFHLYATNVNKLGRIILQSSSDDIETLNRLFYTVVDSYNFSGF